MNTDLWAAARQATTLKDAHEALGRLMPRPEAPAAIQRDFHQRSAAVYARVAEVDRHHHHEATYWANREREKAEQVAASV